MTTVRTNLPIPDVSDSAESTKVFFDSYGTAEIEFNAVDVDTAVSFFTSRGFANDAALITAAVILKQAKIDEIPVRQLLDTLKTFEGIQLSGLIAEILNNNRNPISTLGFRQKAVKPDQISRNIAA
jgi:hypothetical protein